MTQMTTKVKGERTGEGRGQGINIGIPVVSKEYEHPGIVAARLLLLGHVSNREVAKTIDLDSRGGSMTQSIRDSWVVHLTRGFRRILKQAELLLEPIQALFCPFDALRARFVSNAFQLCLKEFH